MKSVRKESAGWVVILPDHSKLGPFKTNAEAWRAMDKAHGEAVNRSQDVSDWVAGKVTDK